jgi:hypothetical protein
LAAAAAAKEEEEEEVVVVVVVEEEALVWDREARPQAFLLLKLTPTVSQIVTF